MTHITTDKVTLTSPSQVAKAITYIALTVLAVFQQAQGHVTLPIVLAMIVAVLGAIPVYFAVGTTLKTVIAFGLAIVQGLVVVVGTTLTGADLLHLPVTVWIGLVISGLAAIGIAIVPNKPLIDARDTNVITALSPEAAASLGIQPVHPAE